jgi:hypothetical protein
MKKLLNILKNTFFGAIFLTTLFMPFIVLITQFGPEEGIIIGITAIGVIFILLSCYFVGWALTRK